MLCLQVWLNLTFLLITPTYFQARNSLAVRIPLLIKIAPDLSQAEMEDIAEVLDICFCEVTSSSFQVVTSSETRIDGLIVSNTSLSREGLTGVSKDEAGGLSGAPISEMSTKVRWKTRNQSVVMGIGK